MRTSALLLSVIVFLLTGVLALTQSDAVSIESRETKSVRVNSVAPRKERSSSSGYSGGYVAPSGTRSTGRSSTRRTSSRTSSRTRRSSSRSSGRYSYRGK